MADETVLPSPALIVLVGPSGSGKSTWADANFRPGQVLSSDYFRALVGSGENDQTAGTDAFLLLNQVLLTRLAKGLTTVVDTLALDEKQRADYRRAAAEAGVACVAIGFDTSAAECRRRNATRPDPIPKTVLDKQLRQWKKTKTALADEGFEQVVIDPAAPRLIAPSMLPTAQHSAGAGTESLSEVDAGPGGSLAFDLVISGFDFEGELEPTLVAMAEAAEASGFRALWVMDHFRQVPQVGRAWDPMLESYTTLAYLAAKTTRLRLGTLVTGVEHRNVGLLAKIIATLDVLSGGRAECGIGAGWFDAEQAAFGYPVNSNRVRLDTLEDALQALPVLWGPGSKSFSGKVLSIPEALAYPRPIQDPVPILVGGGGEQRTLKLAARYGSACNVMGDPATVAHKIDVLHRHCAAVGRDPDEITITTLNPIIHASSGRELDLAIERLRPRNRSAEAFAAAGNAATTDEHVARFEQLRALGVGRICVALTGAGPSGIEAFASVIDAFASHEPGGQESR